MYEELFATTGLSLERLKTFVELVEAKGFTAAARGDSTRQSQFSRQLRELEEYFGVELVSRGHGRFVLTPAGKSLHELVRMQFGALDELRRKCVSQPVEISLGAGESLLQWIVMPRLALIRHKLPGVIWVLQNLQTEEMVVRLGDGRTDFGLMRRDAVPRSLRCVSLGTLRFALFVPKTLMRSGPPSNLGKMLSGLPLAVLEGPSRLNDAFQEIARKTNAALNIQLRCSSFTQVAEAVRTLKFAAVLPHFAKEALATVEVTICALPALEALARPLVLAWNARQAGIRPALQRASKELTSLLAWA